MAMIHKFGLHVTNYLTDFKTVRKTGVRLRYYHILVWSPMAAGIIDHITTPNSYTAAEQKCQNHYVDRKCKKKWTYLSLELSWVNIDDVFLNLSYLAHTSILGGQSCSMVSSWKSHKVFSHAGQTPFPLFFFTSKSIKLLQRWRLWA